MAPMVADDAYYFKFIAAKLQNLVSLAFEGSDRYCKACRASSFGNSAIGTSLA
jgi:hypothetical protein